MGDIMLTMKKEVNCGIFKTELIVRIYSKKFCITKPYIKWVNDSGNLAFEKMTIMHCRTVNIVKDSAKYDEKVFWQIIDAMIQEL
jgi:hypothetical protein